ncbi:hypothetical protein ACLGIH_16200 [Streptomyces sp. HMX87]|uniref:hypothetical protein n=1 Tax=Streptomyces sp. HMX87 TaxID=3390849 RepID=UPI003A874FF6
MAEGDGVATRGVRVQLDDTATERDLRALRMWLEREKPLYELIRDGQVQIRERQVTGGGTGTPMGLGMEIVVAVVGGATAVVFQELLEQVKGAVAAWRANRREVENGEPPGDRVEPVNADDR